MKTVLNKRKILKKVTIYDNINMTWFVTYKKFNIREYYNEARVVYFEIGRF